LPVRELIAHHARLPLPGESTRFKANPQRLFREYRRDQSTSNGENRGELRQAPEIGAASTFRSDYLRSSDDRSAWTAESTGGGSGPCGVGAPFRTPGLCGGKTLRRHISTRHGLSPDEYRRRWGLRSNHPLRLSFNLSIVRPWQGHEASVAGSPHLRPR
jgi:ROS/MUCR transcriptional regulator protein